jgi:hypothetical protein
MDEHQFDHNSLSLFVSILLISLLKNGKLHAILLLHCCHAAAY